MPARKAIKQMAAKEPHLAELAGMAVKGGLWADDRLNRCRLSDGRCCFCARVDAGVKHLMYHCPHFAHLREPKKAGAAPLDDPEADAFQDMGHAASAYAEGRYRGVESLWLRGIVPWRAIYGQLPLAGERSWAGLGIEEGFHLGEVPVVYMDGGGRGPTDPGRAPGPRTSIPRDG